MQGIISGLDTAIIVVYLVGVLTVGLVAGRKTRELAGYVAAGRSLPWWALLGSIVATETSTATFLSVPGISYADGGDLRFLQLAGGLILGRILVALLLLPAYFRSELLSAYQVLQQRFGSATQRVASLLFLGTRNLGDGLRLFLTALALEQAIGMDLPRCVLLIGSITIFYTLVGGMRSVVWNDCIQLVVYVCGGALALTLIIHRLPEGWDSWWSFAHAEGKLRWFDVHGGFRNESSLWAGLIGGAFLSLGTHGTDQMMVQRYLSARSRRDATIALVASGLVVFLQFALFLVLGIALACYYHGGQTLRGDQVFARFIVQEMPPGLVGLLLASVFAAAMSTLSSSLNSSATVAVTDLLPGSATDARRLVWCKLLTIAFGGLQMGLAIVAQYYSQSIVKEALAIAGFASGILLGVFLLGRWADTIRQTGAIFGMLTGAVVVLAVKASGQVAWPWYTVAGAAATLSGGWLAAGIRRGVMRYVSAVVLAGLCCAGAAGGESSTAVRLPAADPADAGLDGSRLQAIEAIVQSGLRREEMAGAVVVVGYRGHVVYRKAFGDRQVEPRREPMTVDTLFDLASLTKPIATATSILRLVEDGRIDLDAPVAGYLPEFGRNGKDAVSVRQLLTHQGGLIADNSLRDYEDGREQALERIWDLGLVAPPGERFLYTDVGFIVLAELVARVAGQDIHRFTQETIFQPLGMRDTGYLPGDELRARAAATEQREGRWMRGEVHDPRAWRLGGIAGHAGLFSTAEDLAIYAQMLLQQGSWNGVQVLAPETVRTMIRPQTVPGGGLRGLGWDIRSGYSSNRGDLFSDQAFGHGGFTGTGLWIDPELQMFVVFLSNRLHPDGKGSVNALIARVGTVAVAAIDPCTDGTSIADKPIAGKPIAGKPIAGKPIAGKPIAGKPIAGKPIAGKPIAGKPIAGDPATGAADRSGTEVLAGIDVLLRDDCQALRGARIGLITNHTGIARSGLTTAQALARADGVQLVAMFSPEHGIQGRLDVAEIGDSHDDATGVPIYSLYGETRRPTAASLQGLDTLVFDIQDIGTRFYTYISTMQYALQAAAENDLRFVVLDRPNPINGVDVAGPVLDEGLQSFVGCHPLPVRHGMTVGELARMFRAELRLSVDLQVIPVEGWRRADYFDRTGLVWINPSPNMRSLTEALLYPGIGLLETTNLSVGRGTDTPFEVLGAPWLDGVALARRLNAAGLPGVRFVPIRFTPTASRFAGEPCGGVNVLVTDRAGFRPVRTGLEIARVLASDYPETWQTQHLGRLLADASTRDALLADRSIASIEAGYQDELQRFQQRRRRYLIYPE